MIFSGGQEEHFHIAKMLSGILEDRGIKSISGFKSGPHCGVARLSFPSSEVYCEFDVIGTNEAESSVNVKAIGTPASTRDSDLISGSNDKLAENAQMAVGKNDETTRSSMNLNVVQETYGYIRPDKIFGHVHIAKTGGTTGKIYFEKILFVSVFYSESLILIPGEIVNSLFANKFERVCGNKGSSYEAYAQNEKDLKKLHELNKDSLYPYNTNHSSAYPGFEDCDYISQEVTWNKWSRNFPGGKLHNVPVELHVPCRDPLDHLMSQCNQVNAKLACGSSEEDFYKSIDKCLRWENRFDFRLKDDFSIKCYAFGTQFKEYIDVMARYLQPRRFEPEIIVPRHSNKSRNKTAECIWGSPDLQKMATDYLMQKWSYYQFCAECIGGDNDIVMLEARNTVVRGIPDVRNKVPESPKNGTVIIDQNEAEANVNVKALGTPTSTRDSDLISGSKDKLAEKALCASGEMRYFSSYKEEEKSIREFSSGFDHWMAVGKSEGKEYKCSLKSPHQLWINVMSYREGIGGWLTSLQELLFLVKEVSATLVEPCMKDGHLGSCGRRGWVVPVSNVLDLSFAFQSLDNRPPLMVPYAKYHRKLKHFNGKRTNHSLCLGIGHKEAEEVLECEQGKTSLIEDILDETQFTSLDLFNYWWKSSLKILSDILKIGHLHDNIRLKQLSFHRQHVNTVHELLKSANIHGDDFSIIHWRAEKEGMDIMECAKAVLNTRRTMDGGGGNNSGATAHPYLLMTSLNEDSGKFFFVGCSLDLPACMVALILLFVIFRYDVVGCQARIAYVQWYSKASDGFLSEGEWIY